MEFFNLGIWDLVTFLIFFNFGFMIQGFWIEGLGIAVLSIQGCWIQGLKTKGLRDKSLMISIFSTVQKRSIDLKKKNYPTKEKMLKIKYV